MLTWLLLGTALAGVPVVFDGGAAGDVVATVAGQTGLPAEQLDATTLDDLLEQPPQVLGDGVIRRCVTGPAQGSEVQADLVRAEAAWARGDATSAQDHLDLAVARLGCLGELVDPSTAARVFLLRGALAEAAGAHDVARAEIRTALAMVPDLPWDSRFPVGGAVLLAEEQGAAPALSIRVMPAGTSSGPWVDGRTIGGAGERVPVSAALHLAQYPTAHGIRSAWLLIDGDSTLVLPGSYRQPILGLLADPATAAPVESLLQGTLPDFTAAYVHHGGGTWLVALEENAVTTTELVAPPPPPDADSDDDSDGASDKRHRKGRKTRSR